jgi:hypothetical protein
MKKFYQIFPIFCFGCLMFWESRALASLPTTSMVEKSISWGNSSSEVDLVNSDSNPDNKFVLYIADGMLNIKYNKPAELANGEVIVFNLLGQEIIRKRLEINTLNQVTINTKNTCYIVKISYSGKIHTQKVVPSN